MEKKALTSLSNKTTQQNVESDYIKFNEFKQHFILLVCLPIKFALRASNYSLTYHCNQINNDIRFKRFNYKFNANAMTQTFLGKNSFITSPTYLQPWYEYFNIELNFNEFARLEQLDKEFTSLYKKKDGSNLSKLRTLKPKSIRYVKRLQLLEKQA